MTPTETTAAPTPADLGVEWAIYAPELDRFPWQLAVPECRVALVSADLSHAVVVPGGEREPGGLGEVPAHLIPPAVLAAAKGALDRAGRDEVAELLARRRQIAQVWSVDDVVAVRPDLTDDEAWAVLQEVVRRQDADHGITWQTLADVAADVFGGPPDDGGQARAGGAPHGAARDATGGIDEPAAGARGTASCLASVTRQRDALRAALHRVQGLAEGEYGSNDEEFETLADIAGVCAGALG